MPVTRRTHQALQARYELALEQRDEARDSLATSRTIVNAQAEELDLLRAEMTARGKAARESAELARAKQTIKSLDEQLRVLEASNLELSRAAMEHAGTAVAP